MTEIDILRHDQVLAVVRANRIPDTSELCRALVAGGIRTVELTFTTPDVVQHISGAVAAATQVGAILGVGTVMTDDQARAAIDAGARFLVTPGIRPGVAKVATDRAVPVFLGAFTPTEVAMAVDLGATAVKIFPARTLGPGHLSDLHGPYPDVELVPSGGINEHNAHAYLEAGALAVCAGTSVVPPASVEAGAWSDITDRAKAFVAELRSRQSS
ncbi:bifunctional 4-hydroxy-2-oxoglutarate aldolase/2-dehydro-3-deoxy-phosphogluconate aldolase [Rhodococcus sp. ABRD24]|uniref:bifunctional 4-hydroxy-2-oxoglutarate aldolase/2-dehydro-3-deoxy-phosphogluconate aldolase n=1 Tax=Rhodococcus sp. ABRD24 TaxID=2507582 RepID=UPI00103CC82A|nr:bifunctional 4-hydroxy-2-oxoglutarate aldolase/2-dehydro-3-deoxy-phosphogluconate aldolase [Rhodococcus sp. ABRD24]QBJ95883.1 bifunctional 4-hydroxy-2-oxoglutarate aldolase/2-dehydro-3-deoxy-phosphogluconate aldolase [Rhodococcus sp. ABRD24]